MAQRTGGVGQSVPVMPDSYHEKIEALLEELNALHERRVKATVAFLMRQDKDTGEWTYRIITTKHDV